MTFALVCFLRRGRSSSDALSSWLTARSFPLRLGAVAEALAAALRGFERWPVALTGGGACEEGPPAELAIWARRGGGGRKARSRLLFFQLHSPPMASNPVLSSAYRVSKKAQHVKINPAGIQTAAASVRARAAAIEPASL